MRYNWNSHIAKLSTHTPWSGNSTPYILERKKMKYMRVLISTNKHVQACSQQHYPYIITSNWKFSMTITTERLNNLWYIHTGNTTQQEYMNCNHMQQCGWITQTSCSTKSDTRVCTCEVQRQVKLALHCSKLGYLSFLVGIEIVIRRGQGNVLFPDMDAGYVGMSSL